MLINLKIGRTKGEAGFTLLELVISVTILALILGIILGAMRLGSRSWEVEDKRIDRLQRTRVTYDIIAEDIKSILCLPKPICPERKGCNRSAILFIGEQDRIKFVSSNPGLDRRLSRNNYRSVTYFLGQNYSPEYKGVVMEEANWLFPDFFRFDLLCDTCDSSLEEIEYDTYTHIVYPEVSALTFRYYGKKLTEAEADWYEQWNPLENLCSCDPGEIQNDFPEKIEITMVRPSIMGDEGEEIEEEFTFIVPITCKQESIKHN